MPRFEPKNWHACTEQDWESCPHGVNCYSYALNQPGYYWAVPGWGFMKGAARTFFDAFNARFKPMPIKDFREALINGAEHDGLIPSFAPSELRKGRRANSSSVREGHYLAVLLFPENDHDFHFYRQDDDGSWSHKDGWKPAKSVGATGTPILDPIKDAAPLYPIFGSYFLVPRSVKLKCLLPLQNNVRV